MSTYYCSYCANPVADEFPFVCAQCRPKIAGYYGIEQLPDGRRRQKLPSLELEDVRDVNREPLEKLRDKLRAETEEE